MGALAGRRIVLGVSGGIAAYKAIELCRRLSDAGAVVSPVLTADATRFVTPLTFSALAAEPARTSLFDGPEPSPHTTLGRRADLVVVAPATARTLAAYAAGLADDLLVATLLMARGPVLLCPAMHTEMWRHPSTQDNIALLRRRGVYVLEPASGRLAGGDDGPGRLREPEEIVAECERITTSFGAADGDLAGRRLVVTSGGTREPIDPVRFIGNRSSGKQGHALAREAAARGAAVVLVSTVDRPVPPGVEVVRVDTAAEMLDVVVGSAAAADAVVMAAAVADWRPKQAAPSKIKKWQDGVPEVVMEPTVDILAELGRHRRPGQVLVGFAAETDDVRDNAVAKLTSKGLDLIVANDVTAAGAGFEHDTNRVVLITADGAARQLPLASKDEVARAVVDAVVARLGAIGQAGRP